MLNGLRTDVELSSEFVSIELSRRAKAVITTLDVVISAHPGHVLPGEGMSLPGLESALVQNPCDVANGVLIHNQIRSHTERDHLPPIRETPEEVPKLEREQIVIRSYVGGLVKSFERRAA